MFGDYQQVLVCFTLITITCGTSYDSVKTSAQNENTATCTKLFIVISEDHTKDTTTACNASECQTLAYFMNHSSDYFKSNQIYQFQAGIHTPLNCSTVNVTSVSNLTLRGPGLNLTNESALIDCNGASVAFEFTDSSNIIIQDLEFNSCAPGQHQESDSVYDHGYSVLYFLNNTDVYLWRLGLSKSVDEAFYIQDTIGDLQLKKVRVTDSNTANREIMSAGNAIVYRTCSKQVSQFLLEDSVFLNNSNLAQSDLSKCPTPASSKGGVPHGGGLSIRIECDNIGVKIHNLIMRGNAGGDGGNLELLFDRLYSMTYARVEILNSHFESGYGIEGGGIRIAVLPSVVHTIIISNGTMITNMGTQSSKRYRIFLSVINTTFTRNVAIYAGAGVYIKQEQAIGLHTELGIIFYGCAFINNVVCKTGFGGIAFHSINYHTTGYYHHETPQFRINVEHCEFHGNHARNNEQRSGSGTGVVFTKLNEYFELNNSQIYNNNSTGVLAISSNIIASGDITITDNREGSSGGGILLCQNAVIYFNARATITIANNSVKHAGGGICVETECLQSKPPCFFQLGYEPLINRSLMDTIEVNVFNNSAHFAGDNLFGGSINYCYMIDDPKHKANRSTVVFSKMFNIVNNTINPSSVTSSPLTVCLCNEKRGVLCADHDLPPNSSLINRHVFRGERFPIKVAIVGQQNGLVPGTVHAWLKGIQLNNSNSLEDGQNVQKIGTKRKCYNVHYTIRTTYPAVTLQLGVEPSGDVSGFELLYQYKRLEINVTLKKCPVGFARINGSCDCKDFLSIRKIKCDIRDQTISDVFPHWIGLVDNSLVYQRHCPYDYCSKSNVKIKATETAIDVDQQCAPNRTGIMCGQCTEGLSMVFSTNECKYCSNNWLLLLFVYAILGVIIVLMLTVLDLTISEGTFGGLIFYCNIVRSNFSTFFRGESIPYLTPTLKLFISLFNLETGQSICFYNGMDAYARNWLHFGFPLYLWFLTGVMICLSKWYSWIARRNAVKVLATLILLSYAQHLISAIDALQVASMYKEGGHHELRWLGDGSLKYFEGKHIPLALFALLFGLLLLPFAFALLFIQCLQKVSHYRLFSWVTRLKPMFDAYTGPFNANARFWTGLLLIVRILILIASTINTGGDPSKTVDLTLLSLILLLATSQVLSGGLYRKHCLNILESWFLINLAILCSSVKTHFIEIASHFFVGLAFLTAIGILIYHISKVKAIRKFFWLTVQCCCRKKKSYDQCDHMDWNDDVDRYQVEKFPQFVPIAEDREPLLAGTS